MRHTLISRWGARSLLAVAALALAWPAGAQTAPKAPAKAGAKHPAAATSVAPTPGAGPVVVVETAKGTFEFETYPDTAPKTVAHILALVKRNFYNGQRIQRVSPGFVVQLGDPQTRDMSKRDMWGRGLDSGSGNTIGTAEISKKHLNSKYAVGLAHPGDPTQGDSQFYITLVPVPRLDGKYTVFGKVISGFDVLPKLQVADSVKKISVKPGSGT